MRKIAPLCLSFAFCALLVEAKAPPKPADFSGTWTLDTNQTKKVPQGLESYTMLVAQDTQEVKVQTKLEGDLRPTGDLSAPYPQGGQGTGYSGRFPGTMGGGMGRIGGMGMPGGRMGGPMSEGTPVGVGTPGGTGGRPRMERHSPGAAAAFTLYPERAVYKLDGSGSSVELGGPMHDNATAKAAWAKGGKQIRLSLAGTGNSEESRGAINVKDQWKLSKDRQHLLVDRTVHTPSGSASIHLVFDKQAVGSGQAGANSQKG
jgi:hypothetical protein